MEVTQWYAISLGALVALCLSYRLFLAALSAAHIYGRHFFLKHLIYPQIPRILRGKGTITRLHSLIILLYISGNVVCVVFGTTSTTQLRTRTGLMSLVNLIPLCVGGRVSIVVDFCGLSYENYSRMHRWIGRVVVIQGLMHAIIAFIEKKTELQLVKLPGLMAAIWMLLLFLLSLSFIRRLFYEFFLKLHLLFAIATIVTLWYHILPKTFKIYLIVATSVLGAVFVLRVSLLLYRNFSQGRYAGKAVIQRVHNAGGDEVEADDTVKISLKVQRPWKLQAGQYIYLCMPRASSFAWFQSHPFVVAWWYHGVNGDTTVVFLVRPRRGFTRNILRHVGSTLSAVIEGPYGAERDLGSYGTVVMLATGIGIAGQLLYIRRLLEGYNNCEVRTHNIFLHWQFKKECHEDWVKQWMDELLDLDKHKILKISLFVLGQFKNRKCQPGHRIKYGSSNRITKFYESKPPDVEEFIRDKIKEQNGSIVFAVCTDAITKDKVRKTVGKMPRKDIRFEALHFCP